MPKVRQLAAAALVACSFASAATLPVERLEGESISEDDTGLYSVENLYGNDGMAPPSEGDSDLGEQVLLRPQPRIAPIQFQADSFLFWTDNVSSSDVNEESGWFFGGSLTTRWRQRLNEHLLFDTYAYQDAYFYDKSGLDFQSTELGAGLITNVPSLGDLTIFARYEFLYLHADNPFVTVANPQSDFDSRFHRVRLGAHKTLYSRTNHVVGLSVNSRWDFDATNGAQRRRQISTRLGYTWAATSRLNLSTYYRLSYRDYLDSHRKDWNHLIGVELIYSLNDWASIYSSIHVGHNDSNILGRDYDVVQGGLGIGLRASF